MQSNRLLNTRLKYERSFLEKYFNGEKFPFKRKNGETFFERQVTTSSESVYRLRVYIPPNYPFELPEMVVCDSPKPMPEWKGSHRTHTWDPKNGFLKICYFRPACWTEKNEVYEVFNKGEEWLEAYEKYLATGKWINEILVEMEPSDQELAQQRHTKACFEQSMRELFTLFAETFANQGQGALGQGALDDHEATTADHLGAIEPFEGEEATNELTVDEGFEQLMMFSLFTFAINNELIHQGALNDSG